MFCHRKYEKRSNPIQLFSRDASVQHRMCAEVGISPKDLPYLGAALKLHWCWNIGYDWAQNLISGCQVVQSLYIHVSQLHMKSMQMSSRFIIRLKLSTDHLQS